MYLHLVKVFFKESFSLKRLFGFNLKENKLKTVLIGFAILYALVAFLGGFGFLFFDLAKILSEQNQLEVVLSFLATYTLGLSVMMALFRSSGYIFHYKDYDILAPLPIKDQTVLLAKLTVMILMIYITSIIFIAPIAFGYFYFGDVSFFTVIYFILGFLLAPLVPIVVLSFVSLLITTLTSKLPGAKLLNIIFMFAFFLGIFALTFSVNETEVNPLTGQINMVKGLATYYPMIEMFINSVHHQDHVAFLLYAGISIGVFMLYVLLITNLVKKTNQSKRTAYFNRNKAVTFQSSHVIMTLVKKEFKTYFSIPIYVLNTGLGVVIIIAMSVASLFFKQDIEAFLIETTALNVPLLPLVLIVFGFSIVMTYTSAVSLSLEGKHFSLLKSLPIDPHDIMLSKVLFNMLLVIPASILGITLISFALALTPVEIFLLLLLVTGLSTLSSLMGSFINLALPKFEFSNEVEVIKQSIASLLAVFGGFALLVTFGFLYSLLDKVLSSNMSLFLIGILLYAISIGLYVLLKPTSRKRFLKF